jgi:hypothetical protein
LHSFIGPGRIFIQTRSYRRDARIHACFDGFDAGYEFFSCWRAHRFCSLPNVRIPPPPLALISGIPMPGSRAVGG